MIPFIFISIVVILASIMVYKAFVVTNHNYKQKPLEKDEVDQTTVEPKPLFCKDCKHLITIKRFGVINHKCGKCKKNINPQGDDYLVTGIFPEITPDAYYYYCSTARSSEYMCGKDAALFDPKETNK